MALDSQSYNINFTSEFDLVMRAISHIKFGIYEVKRDGGGLSLTAFSVLSLIHKLY